MDEARAVAEEIVKGWPWWIGQVDTYGFKLAPDADEDLVEKITGALADAVAQAVKERNQSIDYSMYLDRCVDDLYAQTQRLTTDLAGAEATNAILDEEIKRLRAERDQVPLWAEQDARVAQATRAERERCIRLTCRYCADGWEVDSEGLHTIPKSGFVTPGHLCRAEALRRAPPEPTPGSVPITEAERQRISKDGP